VPFAKADLNHLWNFVVFLLVQNVFSDKRCWGYSSKLWWTRKI